MNHYTPITFQKILFLCKVFKSHITICLLLIITQYLLSDYLQGSGLWCLTSLSTRFQLYRGTQFIGGGNWSAWRKSLTCRKSLTNWSHNFVSSTLRLRGIRTHNNYHTWSRPQHPSNYLHPNKENYASKVYPWGYESFWWLKVNIRVSCSGLTFKLYLNQLLTPL